MSASSRSASSQVYKRLKKGFRQLSDMLDAHLDESILHELSVDATRIDLEEETQRGGPYFQPLSQARMDSLDKRGKFCIDFDEEECARPIYMFCDGDTVNLAFRSQLLYNNDESSWKAYESSHWMPRCYKSSYQMRLQGDWGYGCGRDPTHQCEWRLETDFAAEGFPHRSCIGRSGVHSIQGLLRSEMMIIVGMMISAMREKKNEDVAIVPVIFVSILGRQCRIIQAHVSLEERRLKVRYSQLYNFEDCSQRLMDLFLRWILSDPLLEPKLQPEADDIPGSSSGDTAPHMKTSSGSSSELRNEMSSMSLNSNNSNTAREAVSAKG